MSKQSWRERAEQSAPRAVTNFDVLDLGDGNTLTLSPSAAASIQRSVSSGLTISLRVVLPDFVNENYALVEWTATTQVFDVQGRPIKYTDGTPHGAQRAANVIAAEVMQERESHGAK
jgi:hypothetical protein